MQLKWIRSTIVHIHSDLNILRKGENHIDKYIWHTNFLKDTKHEISSYYVIYFAKIQLQENWVLFDSFDPSTIS